MRPTRNWTTYVPESESALRKKCIELSPTYPLSSSIATATSKSVTHSTNNGRSNQNNNNNHIIEINGEQQRNGMKAIFLCKSSDSVIKTVGNQFESDDDNNDEISASLSATQQQQQYDTPTTTATSTSTTNPTQLISATDIDKDFENSASANKIIDFDVDFDKSSSILECAPLIQLSPNKSITLVKQNSTSLIFTKKDVNPVVHRRRITLVRSTGSHSNSEITKTTTAATATETATPTSSMIDGIPITDETILSPKKRHSFHWHSDRNIGISPTDKVKRKQIKSWYAVIGSSSVRESAFDRDSEVRFHYYYFSIF